MASKKGESAKTLDKINKLSSQILEEDIGKFNKLVDSAYEIVIDTSISPVNASMKLQNIMAVCDMLAKKFKIALDKTKLDNTITVDKANEIKPIQVEFVGASSVSNGYASEEDRIKALEQDLKKEGYDVGE